MSEKKPTYWELLRHPKWQEKRLRVMQRAGFECENCGDKDTILNVHHTYYEKGKSPWEYPDESLRCLCESCHGNADELRRKLLRQLGLLTDTQLNQVLGFSIGLMLEEGSLDKSPEEENYEMLLGMIRVFLTLSGHQTKPVIDAMYKRCGRTGVVVTSDLMECCECSRVADEARPRDFNLIP
jgi:hypothetical protein